MNLKMIVQDDFCHHPDFDGHEQVIHCTDPRSGLNGFIAVHNTHLGPAMGGCRMWPYAREADALTDVLRLSHGMTYKAALANLEMCDEEAMPPPPFDS